MSQIGKANNVHVLYRKVRKKSSYKWREKNPGKRRRETCVHKMSQVNADYSMFMQAGCTGTGTLGRLLSAYPPRITQKLSS